MELADIIKVGISRDENRCDNKGYLYESADIVTVVSNQRIDKMAGQKLTP